MVTEVKGRETLRIKKKKKVFLGPNLEKLNI